MSDIKIMNIKRYIDSYNSLTLVRKAMIWITISSFLNTGINIITLPIITRVLIESEIGLMSVYNTWYTILQVIFTLNLFAGIFEVLLTKNKDNDKLVVSSLTFASLFFISMFFILFLLSGEMLSQITGLPQNLLYILFFDIFFFSIIQFWATKNRFDYNYKLYTSVIITLTLSKAILSILLILIMKENLVFFRILGLSIPNVILGIVLLIKLLFNTKFSKIIFFWKEAILFNILLIPHYLSNVLLSSSDRILIFKLIGAEKAGIYSIAYSYASLLLILFLSINSSFAPFAYKAINDKNYEELNKKTIENFIILGIFVIILILFAPEAIYILAGANYNEGIQIVPILTIGIYFMFFYTNFSYIEFIFKKNKLITISTLIGAVINISLNYFLLPLFGIIAAAYATVVGYGVMAVGHYLIYRSLVKKPIYNMKLILSIITLVSGLSFVITLLYPLPIIRYLFLLIIIIVFIFLLKNKFKIFQSDT